MVDVKALANALRHVSFASPHYRMALGQRAAARAAHFTWSAAGRQLKAVCDALAHREEEEEEHGLRSHVAG